MSGHRLKTQIFQDQTFSRRYRTVRFFRFLCLIHKISRTPSPPWLDHTFLNTSLYRDWRQAVILVVHWGWNVTWLSFCTLFLLNPRSLKCKGFLLKKNRFSRFSLHLFEVFCDKLCALCRRNKISTGLSCHLHTHKMATWRSAFAHCL